ncbi:hypothetical protein HPB48_026710 [Haemaphysalis longicornis]|uniref:Uncharacterized protein n=1 Tax=Haemaphysalis longicornis TaxID=44386 RepID=A0A9J6HAG6_HAELO|nr:hypothetical protein HPB48_026710 [Haemaphysalis longicornis]
MTAEMKASISKKRAIVSPPESTLSVRISIIEDRLNTFEGLTFVEHEMAAWNMQQVVVQIIPGEERKGSVFLFKVDSNPSQGMRTFKTLLRKSSTAAGSHTLLAGGEFNAMHPF